MPIDHMNGWWTVKNGCKQWAAWVHWRKSALGLNYAGDALTVISEWPPVDVASANQCAAFQNAALEKFKSPRRVPQEPFPWNGHVPKDWQDERIEPSHESKARVAEMIEHFKSNPAVMAGKKQTFEPDSETKPMPHPDAQALGHARASNPIFQSIKAEDAA